MGEQDVGRAGRHTVPAAPRLTRLGAREGASLARSGSRRPSSSPFGFHVEAPALPGAGEVVAWLPGTDELAPSLFGAAELELAAPGDPKSALSRVAPLFTAGLLGVVVALLFVLAAAAPR